MTVADYCAAMDRNDIKVNRKYQRSDKVWPDPARSFLIESMLLGYPISKIYLHSITDLRTRVTTKDIVDGQQRSKAIQDFFHDRFELSGTIDTPELIGKTYSTLGDDWKAKFITYSISVDTFAAADANEVIQIFRRMNSYTVPLNPEEQRYAQFQGRFKWFIYELARDHEDTFRDFGVLPEKALVRMQDMKLLTEVCHAMSHGIATTSKKSLDRIYADFDERFPDEGDYRRVITSAFETLSEMTYLQDTNLVKPFVIYSLLIALIHWEWTIPGLTVADYTGGTIDHDVARRRLLELSEALELDADRARRSRHRDFIRASSEKTNVKANRETRVRALIEALRPAIT